MGFMYKIPNENALEVYNDSQMLNLHLFISDIYYLTPIFYHVFITYLPCASLLSVTYQSYIYISSKYL